MLPATKIRVGMVLVLEGELYRVLKVDHLTPGNLRAKVMTQLRSLRTGLKNEHRFRAEDTVEQATFVEKEMEYLYQDAEQFIFMDTSNYEQIHMSQEDLGNAVHYLQPNTKVMIEFYEERPIGVELPGTMVLEITETDPPMKGATASGSAKPAVLTNGLTVKVPQFIQVGDKVKVDTSSNEYVERAE